MSSDANADDWNAALAERGAEKPTFDPYAHRRRLAFRREDLAGALGLLPDVHIISVQIFNEPIWIEVFVTSPRFPSYDDQYQGERRIETMDWTVPVEGYGPGRMLFTGMSDTEPVQHEVEFTPTWIEGWKMAMEWLREQGSDSFADEMETRLPE